MSNVANIPVPSETKIGDLFSIQPLAELGAPFRLQASNRAISWVSASGNFGSKRAPFPFGLKLNALRGTSNLVREESINRAETGRARSKQLIGVADIDAAKRDNWDCCFSHKSSEALPAEIVRTGMTCSFKYGRQKNGVCAERLGGANVF